MGDRTAAYAIQVEDLNQQMIATIEGYTPVQMQARCAGEQCTVAALASHLADVHTLAAGWIEAALAGGPLPAITMDEIHSINAEQFARDADRPKDEILSALRENGAAAAALIRCIDDDKLDQALYFTLVDRDVTTEWLVRDILIGDITNHSASIHAAAEQAITV